MDVYAESFGRVLSEVCAHGLVGEQELLARKIGFETGRFIYILDAIDDLEADVQRKRFNPFIALWGERLDDEKKKSLRDALISYLFSLERAMDLLPHTDDPTRREILNNILYLGMPKTLDRVLGMPGCQKEEDRE